MSSRREVLIRIFALLQRKTLIETKNCTLKCLKWHYLTVRSMKVVAVLTEDGAFALFFSSHPGGFDSSRVPTPGNLPSKVKKMLMPGGQPKGGLSAGGIDWCISNKICTSCDLYRTKETCFTKSEVTPVYGVIPALFYPIRRRFLHNLSQLDLLQGSSFCSNVSKQVARFCRPFYSSFQWRLDELANVDAPFCW